MDQDGFFRDEALLEAHFRVCLYLNEDPGAIAEMPEPGICALLTQGLSILDGPHQVKAFYPEGIVHTHPGQRPEWV